MTTCRADRHKGRRLTGMLRSSCSVACLRLVLALPSLPARSVAAGRAPPVRRRRRRAAAPIDLTGYWVSIDRRRMALPRHAAEGRHPLPAAQRRGAADRQRVGSGQRRSRRQAVQGVRRRRRDAAARPPAHHLGEPDHAEDRGRRRHADAPAALRPGAGRQGPAVLAGLFGRPNWQLPGGGWPTRAARRASRRPTCAEPAPRRSAR